LCWCCVVGGLVKAGAGAGVCACMPMCVRFCVRFVCLARCVGVGWGAHSAAAAGEGPNSPHPGNQPPQAIHHGRRAAAPVVPAGGVRAAAHVLPSLVPGGGQRGGAAACGRAGAGHPRGGRRRGAKRSQPRHHHVLPRCVGTAHPAARARNPPPPPVRPAPRPCLCIRGRPVLVCVFARARAPPLPPIPLSPTRLPCALLLVWGWLSLQWRSG
jgi:hypothetical protein